jgi:hypothetical protein
MMENELGEKRYLIWGWLSVSPDGLLSLITSSLSHAQICAMAHGNRAFAYVTGQVSQA